MGSTPCSQHHPNPKILLHQHRPRNEQERANHPDSLGHPLRGHANAERARRRELMGVLGGTAKSTNENPDHVQRGDDIVVEKCSTA